MLILFARLGGDYDDEEISSGSDEEEMIAFDARGRLITGKEEDGREAAEGEEEDIEDEGGIMEGEEEEEGDIEDEDEGGEEDEDEAEDVEDEDEDKDEEETEGGEGEEDGTGKRISQYLFPFSFSYFLLTVCIRKNNLEKIFGSGDEDLDEEVAAHRAELQSLKETVRPSYCICIVLMLYKGSRIFCILGEGGR